MLLNVADAKTIDSVVDKISERRRNEVIRLFFTDNAEKDWINQMKAINDGKQRSKGAGWRKIASLPYEVDQFFTKMFGDDYFKDNDFWNKFPEWLIFTPDKLNK